MIEKTIDLKGRIVFGPAGVWTIAAREPTVRNDAMGRDILRIELSCGELWHMVDVHVDRATHFVEHRGDIAWILDALREWLQLPDSAKSPVLLLGR